MRYYATRPLRVGDGTRQPGEEVPEAAEWKNIRLFIGKGWIAAVPDEVRQPPPPPPTRRVGSRRDRTGSTETKAGEGEPPTGEGSGESDPPNGEGEGEGQSGEGEPPTGEGEGAPGDDTSLNREGEGGE